MPSMPVSSGCPLAVEVPAEVSHRDLKPRQPQYPEGVAIIIARAGIVPQPTLEQLCQCKSYRRIRGRCSSFITASLCSGVQTAPQWCQGGAVYPLQQVSSSFIVCIPKKTEQFYTKKPLKTGLSKFKHFSSINNLKSP
jgi:hypothetical protein